MDTRRRVGIARVGLLAVLLLLGGGASAAEFTGRVVAVVDGDTITVLHGRRAERLRLVGIDAPEKRQDYGEQAKRFVSALAFGRTVTVEPRGHDRNGRVLAEVVLPDGRSLNRELVRSGYAWWFRRYSHDPVLAALEAEARREHRGLWAAGAAVPPWEFRAARRHRGS